MADAQFADGRPWLLDHYSLADIKWYSMTPSLPRLAPELCDPQATPGITD